MPVQSLGKYQLLEQVGQGGMATVFKAIDPATNSYWAMKVLNPMMAQDPQFGKRFEREAEVVMRLQHPHIVPVVDYGQANGYAYLVMPLLKVGSLADRLRDGPLTPLEGGRVVRELSGALEFAHSQGVVHRDVKPSNVLMDDQGNALLSDFGLARIHDASVSLTGSALLGTPAYMSPEQAKGEKVGPASDQYSMGVILYQLCTGHLPFEAETPMAVMLKHINEPVPPARLKSPSVPEAIERVIQKATAKKPEERFGSLAELNQAFQAALAHAQDPFSNPAPFIEVPPSSIATPIPVMEVAPQPKKKRNRVTRLAAAAVLLLLFLACPLSGPRVMALIRAASSPAEGSILSPEDLSKPQLTALAGTIEALSTQLAASGQGTQSPEQIQTAVMETLIADAGNEGLVLDPSGTPVMILGLGGTPTPSYSSTPGPSPTPTKTFTPGPSPTPTKTPTITYTPSPGPSPTPSDTPTVTYTPSPGPSPTPTKTSTSTSTPTATKTSIPTKTSTPTSTSGPFPTGTGSPFPPMTPTGSPTSTGMTPGPIPFDPCEGIDFIGLWVNEGGSTIGAQIHNGSPVRIEIAWIFLEWPAANLTHYKFDLAGNVIWTGPNFVPPTSATSLSGDRKIDSGESKPLVAVFQIVVRDFYRLRVGFTNMCEIEAWP